VESLAQERKVEKIKRKRSWSIHQPTFRLSQDHASDAARK
jgi:hypothetical protein